MEVEFSPPIERFDGLENAKVFYVSDFDTGINFYWKIVEEETSNRTTNAINIHTSEGIYFAPGYEVRVPKKVTLQIEL